MRDVRSRPGPKPKRLYARWVQYAADDRDDLPTPRAQTAYWAELERVGRLVAVGPTTDPLGNLLILRAVDAEEAARVLRRDPWRELPNARYELLEWNAQNVGTGVNLEPAPDLGSGRLTALERVTVVVRDQDSALSWYTQTLGLKVRSQDAATRFVELSLGRGAAALSLVQPRPEWGEPYYSETAARIGTATGIAFQTDSVLALEKRLAKGGSKITQTPERQPWGGVTLRFTDPDGNEFLAFQVGTDPSVPLGHGVAVRPPTPGVRWTRASPRSKRL